MPGAPIVIEVSLPSPPETGLATLTTACTRAALGARCVLAKDAHDEVPAAVAIVTFQTEDKVRVEVGVRHGDHDLWRTSEVSFSAGDESSERWRAIGFAIGTLAESEQVGDSEPAAPGPPPAAAPAAPTSVAPVPGKPTAPSGAPAPERGRDTARPQRAVPPPRAVRGAFLDASGLFGRGLDPAPFRAGAAIALDIPLPSTEALLVPGVSLSGTLNERDELRTARWVDVSLGAGFSVAGDPGRSGFELLGQAFLERFDVRAEALNGIADSRGRWLFGVEGTARGRIGLSSGLCLIADLRLATLSGATSLRVADQTIAEAPTLRYTAGLGLRLRLR